MSFTRRRALAIGGAACAGMMIGGRAQAVYPANDYLKLTDGQLTQGGWARGVASLEVTHLTLDSQPVSIGQDGRFLIAFDRDAKPMLTLMGGLTNRLVLQLPLTITPRQWPVENIDAPFHPPAIPDVEFMKIRTPELAQIGAARAKDTGASGWRQNFHWPTRGRVSGLFGAQRIYQGKPAAYHPGIDIAVPTGTPYVAPADGVVILAADHPFTLEGNLLMVAHGMGLNSAFLHCSRLLVQEGDRVTQGQTLGLTGMTGRATGPHLHWALKWRESRLDPLLFTGPMV